MMFSELQLADEVSLGLAGGCDPVLLISGVTADNPTVPILWIFCPVTANKKIET